MEKWLVVTDLDGTLLDETYPVEAAAEALATLAKARPVSIALASSKTLAEMQVLSALCPVPLFFLFENGAGVAWPTNSLADRGDVVVRTHQVQRLGKDYVHIRFVLNQLRAQGFKFRGFGDMTDREVAERTGLGIPDAGRARQRVMTEPLLWQGTDVGLERFKQALKEKGLTLQLGGQFYHVSSANDKAAALTSLVSRLASSTGQTPKILACGDAPNDLAMLEAADRALVFPGSDSSYLAPRGVVVNQAVRAGPGEWLAGVLGLLSDVLNPPQEDGLQQSMLAAGAIQR